jgi:hypothetical protein
MAALMSSPSLSPVVVDAASSWALQLRLDSGGASSSGRDGPLAAAVPLALLAPHYARCAKALLNGRYLDVMVAALLDELSSITAAPKTDLDALKAPTAVRRRAEVALALTTATEWLARSSPCVGAPKRKAHVQVEGDRPGKRVRGEGTSRQAEEELIWFVVGGERFESTVGDIRGLSSLLDSLLETVGSCEAKDISIPCPCGLSTDAVQRGVRLMLAWAAQGRSSSELGERVTAETALELWQLADFLDVSVLKCACESAVAAGFAGDERFWMRVFNIAARRSCESNLLPVCTAYLARNLQRSIASGNLINLASGAHRGVVQEGMLDEIRRMLAAAVRPGGAQSVY